MGEPRVSVIIPAYNAARTIGDTLRSVRSQSLDGLEVFVVDDGSSDDTAERARAAGEAQVLAQPNGGPGRARNLALARARGRFVAFLDADDMWFPDALETLYGYAERYPEAAVVFASFERPFNSSPQLRPAAPPRRVFCEIFHQRLKLHMGAVLVRREVLDEVGGFDERRELYVEDWDLWLRIAARHPFGQVPRPVVWCRTGGVMSRGVMQTYRGQLLAIDKIEPLCDEACPEARRDHAGCLAARRHRTHQAYGRALLRIGQREAARRAFLSAVETRPVAVHARLLWMASFLGDAVLPHAYAVRDFFGRLASAPGPPK
jgi:glycosyltransferase involved in cell wall biosynthesis